MDSRTYFVLNIREYLGNAPLEEDLSGLQNLYECPLSRDVEHFLKKSAVEFAKKHQAVSYLVFSKKNGALLGYFALAIKTISVKAQNVSKTIQRKLSRMSTLDDDGEYNIPAYLIAQLGKNFQAGLNDSITGNELFSLAMDQILLMQHRVGGVLCVLECENKKKLLDFYCVQNHFVEFGTRRIKSSDKNLLQLLKTI